MTLQLVAQDASSLQPIRDAVHSAAHPAHFALPNMEAQAPQKIAGPNSRISSLVVLVRFIVMV